MIIKKTILSFKKIGTRNTLKKIFKHPFQLLERRKFNKNILTLDSTEDRFTWIFRNNHWGHESVSGSGSTIKYTENLRHELPKLISQFNIKKIFDAPCGDFNWMRILLSELNVQYIGADIVKELIESHKANYENETIKFVSLDLISDNFPDSDLMICRDCLFHLSFEDIFKVLRNFINSEIPYLLTTTHKNIDNFENKDIKTGDFRLIDLFTAPFGFPNMPLMRINDWMSPEPEREMCLFNKQQIKMVIDKIEWGRTHS